MKRIIMHSIRSVIQVLALCVPGNMAAMEATPPQKPACIASQLRERIQWSVPPFMEGVTPLHWAVWGGRFDDVSVLLEDGDDPNCKDSKGLTPLQFASLGGDVSEEIKSLLRDYGAAEREQ